MCQAMKSLPHFGRFVASEAICRAASWAALTAGFLSFGKEACSRSASVRKCRGDSPVTTSCWSNADLGSPASSTLAW